MSPVCIVRITAVDAGSRVGIFGVIGLKVVRLEGDRPIAEVVGADSEVLSGILALRRLMHSRMHVLLLRLPLRSIRQARASLTASVRH